MNFKDRLFSGTIESLDGSNIEPFTKINLLTLSEKIDCSQLSIKTNFEKWHSVAFQEKIKHKIVLVLNGRVGSIKKKERPPIILTLWE